MTQPLFELPPPEPAAKAAQGSGKPRLSRPNRMQIEMRLAALDDLLAPDHLARLVWAMGEQMDLSDFYDQIQAIEGQAGHPAIDPALLVALWLYATADGVGSARKLDRLRQEQLPYQWLCGGVSVNYHTLSDFRVKHERVLDSRLTRQVAGLMAEGLVTFERTTQDGVRIRASAGGSSYRRRERLEQLEQDAQTHIEQLKAQAQAEAAEDSRSLRQKAAQERAARERLKGVQQALQALGELEKRKAKQHRKQSELAKPVRCSTTDPEAQAMKMPAGGYRPAFNGQLAVEATSGIIVGVDLTEQVDQGQVTPMLDQLKARYGRQPHEHIVDGGFVTHAELNAYEPQPITPQPQLAPSVVPGPGLASNR